MAAMTDPSVLAREQELRQKAEQIVRDHDMLCVGSYTNDEDWCSAAPDGTPLCAACQSLADTIVAALRLQATEAQQELAALRKHAKALSIKDAIGNAATDESDLQARLRWFAVISITRVWLEQTKAELREADADRARLIATWAPVAEALCGVANPYLDTPVDYVNELNERVARLIAERDRLRAALVGLVDVDGKAELEQLEAAMRLMPMPAEDKAKTIDAIHALIATEATT